VIATKYGCSTDRSLGACRCHQNGKGNEQIEPSMHWKSHRETHSIYQLQVERLADDINLAIVIVTVGGGHLQPVCCRIVDA
jgi:hypothetical protein